MNMSALVTQSQQWRAVPAVNLLLNRETRSPVLALLFASCVSGTLVLARILWTGNLHYGFLVWNLFLAWLPLVFALRAREQFNGDPRPNWRFGGLAAAWLLFLPNAPYIFTDLVHLTQRFHPHFWVDLSLVLICALTGLVLGFLSLYLMQSIVRRLYGQLMSWLFIAGAAGLSSFGIYLGRFLRFNSWDVLVRPGDLLQGIGTFALNPMANRHGFIFALLFAAFFFVAYVMLYALTHLPQSIHTHAPQEECSS